MMDRRPLFLFEEVMLLALQREKGTPHFGLPYRFGVSGGLLAELLLERHLAVEGANGGQQVTVTSSHALGDPLLDECLRMVEMAKKRPAPPKTWIGKFAGLRGLKDRVAGGLVKQRILRRVEAKVLLVFSRTVYPERDSGPRRELVKRLKPAIFSYAAEVDARTVVLVALTNGTGVLARVFDKSRLKERKRHLERLMQEGVERQATQDLADAVRTAIAVAKVAAGMAASSGR